MSRIRKSAAVAALAASVVGGAEGLRQTAYPDPATKGKPWTECYGHTGPEVHRFDHKSIAECKALLLSDLDKYGNAVENCMRVPVPDTRYVAILSLAYNIGPGAFCKSSAARLLNDGHTAAGCNAFMKFDRAAGIVFPGLQRRRAAERALCLEGADL